MKTNHQQEKSKSGNILIVDDDQDTCRLLELLFRREGYQTAAAYGGRQALQLVESGPPDLVVLDVMMPEMDGWETFQKMRAICHIPVLFLTAMTSGESAALALQLGADDYMRKPYSPRELLARAETLLARARPGSANLRETLFEHAAPGQPVVAAVIPAYNEERFIGSVVLKARRFAQTVIVVDDGSSDCTAQVAADAGALVISHPSNRGKGAALNTAFRQLRDDPPEVVVMLDGDGQHLPEEISQVAGPVLAGEADIVIGSRYLKRRFQVPRHRIWGHKAFNAFTNLISGVPASDSQSGYRAFSPLAVQRISFHSRGFSVESEMQFIARENELRLVEVPVTIQYRDRPKRPVLSHGMQVLNGVLRLVGQYRPLLFFGVPGMILLLIGFGFGSWVIEIYRHTRTLAVGYSMLSVLFSMLGMLSLSTGIILHSVRGLLIDHQR